MCFSSPVCLDQTDDETPVGKSKINLKWWGGGDSYLGPGQGHVHCRASWTWVAAVCLFLNIPSCHKAGCGTLPPQNKQNPTNTTSDWHQKNRRPGSSELWQRLSTESWNFLAWLSCYCRGCEPGTELVQERFWPKTATWAVSFQNKSRRPWMGFNFRACIWGMRAEELQTNPLRGDEGGSAGILGHFHKSQTMIDLNQRALGPTVDGCEIRADPLPAYRC